MKKETTIQLIIIFILTIIYNGGEYTITGIFNYSVIINTDENVILNLDNVSINSSKTAAIANINSGNLVINLLKDTTNTLKDNGSSACDGAFYSSVN